MRTFAFAGLASITLSIMATSAVWAWSTETAPSGINGANLSNPLNSEETLKALQEKVNGGSGETKSGFFVSGGINQPSDSTNGFQSNPLGAPPASFKYSPNPGFR